MAALTTVAAVKAHLAITSANQDALIAGYVARESKAIEQYTGRAFPRVTRTLWPLNGTGSDTIVLPDGPVVAVSSLIVAGAEVAAARYGWDESAVYMANGGRFPTGRRNVLCSWSAGYTSSATETVGASHTVTPTDGGRAVYDMGVVSAAGVALASVTGTPTAGQYAFADGTYTFAAADEGLSVVLSYWCIPGPIEQACIDMVSQDLKQRDNVGVRSKSLAGETVTYSSDGLSTGVKQSLSVYRRLAPT